MKKNCTKVVLGIFILTVALMSFSAIAWSAEKYNLRMSSGYPLKHPTVALGLKPWVEEVKKASNGKLNIKIFPPNALHPSIDGAEAVAKGIVDMSYNAYGLNKGKFPIGGFMTLPFLFRSATAGAYTAWDLVNQYPEYMEEHKDFHLLWIHASAIFHLHTVKKPVKTLEELKGMKIIIWVADSRAFLEALGAIPLEVEAYDTYLALERGMADGVLCPIAPMRSFKVTDVAKHHTTMNLGSAGFWGAINHKSWKKLPPDMQKLLTEMTGKNMGRIASGALDKGDDMSVKWMKKQGGHYFYEFTPEEMVTMRQKLEPAYQKYYDDTAKAGFSKGKELVKDASELNEKYQKELDAAKK